MSRRRQDDYQPEPLAHGDREDDRHTPREIERRLTSIETTLGMWKWLIGIAIAAVSAAIGAAAVVARLIN